MAEEVRRCSVCDNVYPIDCFNRNGRLPSGDKRNRSACKYCERKRVSNHRKRNPNPFTYMTVKCNRCDEEFSARLSKKPAVLAIICENCFRSQKGNVTKEADNASN